MHKNFHFSVMQQGFVPLFVLIIGIVVLVGALGGGYYVYSQQKLRSVTDFESCAKLYQVMTSYPAQCKTPDGKHFVQQLSDEEKKTLIPPSEVENAGSLKTYVSPVPTASAVVLADTSDWARFEDDRHTFLYPPSWSELKNISSQGSTIAAFDRVDSGRIDHVSLLMESDSYIKLLIKNSNTTPFKSGNIEGTLVERVFKGVDRDTYAYDFVFYIGINGYDFMFSSTELKNSRMFKELETMISTFEEKSSIKQATASPTPVPLTYEQCVKEEKGKNLNQKYMEGEILIMFEDGTSTEKITSILQSHNLQLKQRSYKSEFVIASVPIGKEIEMMCEARTYERVSLVDLNHTFTIPDCSQGPC